VGNYVEPRAAGSVLSVSPMVVLFAIFFGTFLWGLFGTFIGLPIALAHPQFLRSAPVQPLGCRPAGWSGAERDRANKN
jgi:AI-2 transport protein TqsA